MTQTAWTSSGARAEGSTRQLRARMATAALAAVVVTAVALLVAAVVDDLDTLVRGYLIALGCIAAIAAMTHLPAPRPPRGDVEAALAAGGGARPAIPARRRELERVVVMGTTTAGEFHRRLRPVLRDVAAAVLRTGHGVELDDDPARARQLLGDESWDLLRPDRPAPRHPDAPGPGQAAVAVVVERIDALHEEGS